MASIASMFLQKVIKIIHHNQTIYKMENQIETQEEIKMAGLMDQERQKMADKK